MNLSSADLQQKYARMARPALLIGVVGIAALVIGWVTDSKEFYHSYIMGYAYWMTLTLGLLGWTLLHNMTAGKWGFTIRRFLQAGTFSGNLAFSPILLMAILFIPIIIGNEHLYHWMHPDTIPVHEQHMLHNKEFYLNTPFWYARLGFYFLFWIGIAMMSKRMLDQEEQILDPRRSKMRTIQRMSAGGLVLFLLTENFSWTDWTMSLEWTWFSTMYGVIMLAGGVLSAIALSNIMTVKSAEYKPFSKYIDTKTFHDLGNLMFALTVFWAYVSFSQYLIVWSANLAEEAGWYLKRTNGVNEIIGYVLLVFHFAAPFVILIQRGVKRNPKTLKTMAYWILVMHFFDMLWQIKPSFQELGDTSLNIHWLDFAAVLGIGGIWLFFFLNNLAKTKASLLPAHDPRMRGGKPVLDESDAATVRA